MDKTVLYDLSYGVYIIGTLDGKRPTGCVVNSVIQVTSSPATLAISINKNNFTTDCLAAYGHFTVAPLTVDAPPSIIGTFGFTTGRDTNKFSDVGFKAAGNGAPALINGACGYIECSIRDKLDCGTHLIIVADITGAERLTDDRPMTYEYYHRVIKGKAPKNAPTYVEEAPPADTRRYVCTLCGYEYPDTAEFETLGDDYRCPICGAPKSAFELR